MFRTKRRYADEELDGVLQDHPQANRYRQLDDRGEPAGSRWRAATPRKATTAGPCAYGPTRGNCAWVPSLYNCWLT